MRIMSIASGSSGNCTYVGTESTHILIDIGVSKKKIEVGLKKLDLKLSDIDGIFITHEHTDHSGSTGVISRNVGIPIYTTSSACNAMSNKSSFGEFDKSLLKPIYPEIPLSMGDLMINAHSVSHDAADPVCYRVYDGKKSFSLATDLGMYDQNVIAGLSGSDGMLIETNYDTRMLQVSSYPYSLKQRILSNYGHLSNEQGAGLILSILNDHVKAIILGHLSEHSNCPELAYEAVRLEMIENGYKNGASDFNMVVAPRHENGNIIEL